MIVAGHQIIKSVSRLKPIHFKMSCSVKLPVHAER